LGPQGGIRGALKFCQTPGFRKIQNLLKIALNFSYSSKIDGITIIISNKVD